MARILKGGIAIKLEPDMHAAVHPIINVEGVMIETDLSLYDHIMPGLLAQKRAFEIKWNGRGSGEAPLLIWSSTLGELTLSAEGQSLSLALAPAAGFAPTDLGKRFLAP